MTTTTHADQLLIDLDTQWLQIDREMKHILADIDALADQVRGACGLHGTAEQYRAINEKTGLKTLEERLEALFDRRHEIERRIAGTPASTITGIAIKLARALWWIEQDNEGDPTADHDRDIEDHLFISVARDMMRLSTRISNPAAEGTQQSEVRP